MARMIPDIPLDAIENSGERQVYAAARELPDDYTVLYSYKFLLKEGERDVLWEADFVIVHPALGYAVVEVKQNQVGFHNGQWHEYRDGKAFPLHKDPIAQAERAMYAILRRFQEVAGTTHFPLRIAYALCFPDTTRYTGQVPSALREESVWTGLSVENLEVALERLLGPRVAPNRSAANTLVEQVLAPSFKVYASLEDQLAMFSRSSAKVLTEEQERILDETEEDSRKIFIGAAGTGKSFVAMEKARRLADAGGRVFLTCYNRNLVGMFRSEVNRNSVEAECFLDHMQNVLKAQGYDVSVSPGEEEAFYAETLPTLAFDYYSSLPEDEKYTAVVVDEGQDFRENWLLCLEAMLQEGGCFYIFADPRQDLFGHGLGALKNMQVSRHRLTVNLRNSLPICDLLAEMTKEKVRSKLNCGMPVSRFTWETPAEEFRLLQKEIGRLVSQGLSPNRILLLSPHRRENSCLAGAKKIREWPVVDFGSSEYGIKFATIRSFKGLEADVIFLIGLRDSRVCSPADVYVGASRATFLLHLFHHAEWELEQAVLP